MLKYQKSLAKFFTLFALSFMGASQALAICGTGSCDDEYVERLFPSKSGRLYVEMTGDKSSLTCTLYSDKFFKLDLDGSPGSEAIYAMLLTAQSMDKPLGRVRVPDSGNCDIAYVWQDRGNISQ